MDLCMAIRMEQNSVFCFVCAAYLVLQRNVDEKAGSPERERHGIFLQPQPSGKETKKTMSMEIVTETCPAPECNLTEQDIEQLLDEMTHYIDHYEMRSWLGCHHHMQLVSLAHHFLVRLRIRFQQLAPALTVYQVRLLLASMLPKPVFDVFAALQRVRYYQ